MLVGHDAATVAVQSVTPTGRHEKVYNLRVAIDHTYFAGGRDWGFSLWVHNTYSACADRRWNVGSRPHGRNWSRKSCSKKSDARCR